MHWKVVRSFLLTEESEERECYALERCEIFPVDRYSFMGPNITYIETRVAQWI